MLNIDVLNCLIEGNKKVFYSRIEELKENNLNIDEINHFIDLFTDCLNINLKSFIKGEVK